MRHQTRSGQRNIVSIAIMGMMVMTFMSLPHQLIGQESVNDGGDVLRPRYGVFGGLNMNLHTANFQKLPGVPNCCPAYESGSGFAPGFDLLYELPLSSELLLGIRAGYGSQSALLSRTEEQTVEVDGEAVLMDVVHDLDASLGSIVLTPQVGYRLNRQLALQGGMRLGFMMQKDYAQEERIGDGTRRGTFENDRRVRHESSGEIPDASTIGAWFVGGVSYEVPLNSEGTLLAAPEVSFAYGLTPVVSGLDWTAHSLSGGVAIKYSPKPGAPKAPVPPPPPPVIPPPPPSKPVLAASIEAYGVNPSGEESQNVQLQVEEFISTQTRPLLNYVFFEENGSELPSRYRRLRDVSTFDQKEFYGQPTLPVYRDVLNVAGERMATNGDLRLRLVGTNAGVGEEDGNTGLSKSRAESVKEYLTSVWGIAGNRIAVEGRGVPQKASNREELDGQAENRRVEMYTVGGGDVLAPVVTYDTVREATPPVIRFRTDVESGAGVTSWRITAREGGRLLKELEGRGDVPGEVTWSMADDRGSIPAAPGRVLYSLWVKDSEGSEYETGVGSMTVDQVTIEKKRRERLADTEVERYSLILFDYNASELTRDHRSVVKEIRERLRSDSRVKVVGYADRLGDAEYNRKLARERAENVVKALGLEAGSDRVEVRGTTELLYDNNTPEGRFYSRTVTVEVETPRVEGESG